MISFNSKYYLCVEIGGTNLRYGLVDTYFSLVRFHKIPTASFSNSEDKIKYLKDLLMSFIESYGKDNIICITMALASLMDKERTVVYSSPMIRGFENIQLVKLLEESMGLPVIIERDVNTLLLYEIHKQKRDSSGIVSGVFVGTGLGCAMCINGQIYKGSSGAACELGHIPVPGLTQECKCGKKGCIELLTCGKVLERLASKHLKCDVRDIFKLYGRDERILDTVRYLAIAIATKITILDPSYVILGGGVIEMEDFPMEFLISEIRENLRIPTPRETIEFVIASGDDEAGIIGAAINAHNELNNKRVTL